MRPPECVFLLAFKNGLKCGEIQEYDENVYICGSKYFINVSEKGGTRPQVPPEFQSGVIHASLGAVVHALPDVM